MFVSWKLRKRHLDGREAKSGLDALARALFLTAVSETCYTKGPQRSILCIVNALVAITENGQVHYCFKQ